MKKISFLLAIILFNVPIYSNNFVINSAKFNDNKATQQPVFTVLQNDIGVSKIKAKLENNPKAQTLFNELKNYLIVQYDSNYSVLDLIPIRKIVIDTLASTNFIDKTSNSFQADFSREWYFRTCNIQGSWQTSTGKGIVVAVLDTGIDFDNDDFNEKLWINVAEDINKNARYDAWLHIENRNGVFGDIDGIDNDGNGYVDDVIGFDFVKEIVPTFGDVLNMNGNPYDEHGHGTQVASVISAIAPDSKIMGIRTHNVLGESDCIAIANGIIYAVLNGANIINLSSGETEDSPLIHTAIKFAFEMDVVVVCSAGNDGNTLPHFPSDYSEVISVGGINENEMRIFNYGDFIDITAPAVNIYVGNKNNTYRKNNGTSFSAPIVSAVCALLLSHNPNLSPAEVKTQLQLTARSESGWTPEFGGGIVDAKKSLDFVGKAILKIESPNRAEIIDISKENYLTIKGSIAMPLFDNYVVRIRNCRESRNNCEWDTLVQSQYLQVISGELCSINLQEKVLNIGENIISVICQLKSGKSIEERVNVFIINSNFNTNIIEDTKEFVAYYNNSFVNIINLKTYLPTTAKLFYKNKNESEYQFINSVNYIKNNHIFILNNLLTALDTAYIVAQYGDKIQTAPIGFSHSQAPINDIKTPQIKKQPYTLSAGYLSKNSVNKNGQDYLIASLFDANGRPEKIKYFFSQSDTMFCVDSSTYDDVCVAIKNGCILSHYFGQISWHNYSDNRTITIGDGNSWDSSFIGIDLIDIDGIEPIDVFYRDNNGNFFAALINENATNRKLLFNYYDFVKQNTDVDLLKSLGNQLATCFGNFYGDNKNYLAIVSANDAYLHIIEITFEGASLKETLPLADHYHNELTHRNHYLSQNIFIRNADIDGDGIDELIYMYYGKIDDTSDVLGANEVWTIHIYKNENNYWNEIASENILGVRVGNPYINGLNTGDVDNDGTDEILICIYPNLYIFKWNDEHKKIIPFWYYPECNSNLAVVGDFNGNGKNEICFNKFSEIVFFEFENYKPHSVFNFKGHSYNKNSAFFSWESYADAFTEYELLLIESDSLPAGYLKKYTTSEKNINISNLLEHTYYTAFVRIIGDTTFYNPIEIFTNEPTFPISAEAINNKIIKIKFTDRISLDLNNNSNGIKLIAEDTFLEHILFSSVNLTNYNDSSLVVEFDKDFFNGTYTLKIPIFTDIYGNPTLPQELEINIDIAINSDLFLTSLIYEPPLNLIVDFSESIDATALIKDNYTLYPYGGIEDILLIDSNTIKIFLSKNTQIYGRGKDYLLTAHSDITATSGKKMTTGAGNTLGFCISEDNLDSIYVYPAPISLAKHTEAYIARLPNNTKIEILNQYGKLIKTLNETDGNGGIDWNLCDEYGNKCGIGIYFVKVIYANSDEQKLVKFAIIR
ncbi:MAG: S8 family serine peptidase [Bacteroidetes bacterium]|nr:S8 family serine peptidase [Bacteroidota bacterium]